MNKNLRKRKPKHPLHSFFFKKFQDQVSQTSGFKAILSEEDFNKMVQDQIRSQMSELPPETIVPPIEIVK